MVPARRRWRRGESGAGAAGGGRLAGPVREPPAAGCGSSFSPVSPGPAWRSHRRGRTGVDAVVAVGGDGPCTAPCRRSPAPGPLGIVPAGGGNDLAGILGLPAHPAGAVAGMAAGRARYSTSPGPPRHPVGRRAGRRVRLAGGGPGQADAPAAPPAALRPGRMAEIVNLRHYGSVTLDGVATEQEVTWSRSATPELRRRHADLPRRRPHRRAARRRDRRPDVAQTLVRLKPLVRAGTHVRHPLVDQYRARDVPSTSTGSTGVRRRRAAARCR